MHIVILMPVYEDWQAALQLCRNIDAVLRQDGSLTADVLLVDDGSASACPQTSLSFEFVERVGVLTLRRNLGHQRAIAVALAHLQQQWTADAVVVMDADGEDRPEDIPGLVQAMRNAGRPTAVFAERGRRLESLTFRTLYRCYSLLHRIFTGRDIRFGNFSVLPWSFLNSLVVCPELWNHYSATFLKSRLPYIRVRCNRASRLAGESRMNFVSLVIHGMSALFANQEVVGTRLLLFSLLTSAVFVLLVGTLVVTRLFGPLNMPGWTEIAGVLLIILMGQFLVGCFMLVFSIMMSRSHLGFLPIRDYLYFVSQEAVLYCKHPTAVAAGAGHIR
jgi:glycosyltransferase involved in cell wall biosynthesis